MEQRAESPDPVVLSAGTDPSYIPGLDVSGAQTPEAAPPEPGEQAPEDAGAAVSAAGAVADEDAPGSDAEDTAGQTDEPEDAVGRTEEDQGPDEDEEPAFEVSDRRSSIAADSVGIRFRLDDTEARINWSEIGAVEISTPRFARRFAVTVYTRDHRHFDADVEAPARKLLKEWTADLDAVLAEWLEDTSSR